MSATSCTSMEKEKRLFPSASAAQGAARDLHDQQITTEGANPGYTRPSSNRQQESKTTVTESNSHLSRLVHHLPVRQAPLRAAGEAGQRPSNFPMQPSSDDGGALRIEVYRQHFFVPLVNSGPTLLIVLIKTGSPLSVPLPCLFPFEHVNRHPCFFSPSLSENSRPTERQRMYHNTLRKAHTKDHKSILARFLNDRLYRDSQIKIGWDENTCIANDEIAREDHSYAATRWERSRN